MRLRNSGRNYGLVTVLLHWSMALLIVALFALGLYMTSLNYYDPWYKKGPDIHRSLGVVVMGLLVLRIIWRLFNPQPDPEPNNRPWEVAVAHMVHLATYLLILLIGISGYLITTADGRPLEVFDWFAIPSLGSFIEHQEDIAGSIHLGLAVLLIALVVLHMLAALKHHFIDRDRTLLRMLGKSGSAPTNTTDIH